MHGKEEGGLSGPSSVTFFEVKGERWTKEYAELQSLCFRVMRFLKENPEIATKVIITKHDMRSMRNGK